MISTTKRRVAITGMGAVSGFGIGVAVLWDGIQQMRCAIRPIENIATEGLTNRIAAELTGYIESDHFDRRQSSLLDSVGQIAVVSAREAASQAALTIDDIKAMGRRAGVIYGASPGLVTLNDGFRQLQNPHARLHPFSVAKISAAGPACAISIDRGARGACFGIASACATATHAIGVAFDMIRAGALDICFSGGADASIVFGPMKTWEALRLLSSDTVRPFSRDRSGLVLGEGAATLILEEWTHAQSRGVPILGEVVGFGMTADAADMIAPETESVATAMRQALEDAELSPADIGYISAHGTGTRLNDKTETAALKHVFGASPPPASSLKSQVGHTLNAAGGLEAVATTLALHAQLMPATINFREPDPECDIDCVANAVRSAQFDYALSNSFGFGGLNAVLALRRVE
jgi:nodulation protein E